MRFGDDAARKARNNRHYEFEMDAIISKSKEKSKEK